MRSEKGLGHWATGLLATVAACCCCKPHLPTLFIFKVKFAGSLFKYSLLKYFLIALKMRQLRKLWIWVWNWMKSPPKIANYWEKWTYNQVVIISEEHKSGVTEYFWAGWRLSSAYLQAAWNYLVFHQSSSRKMINTEFYPKGRVRYSCDLRSPKPWRYIFFRNLAKSNVHPLDSLQFFFLCHSCARTKWKIVSL